LKRQNRWFVFGLLAGNPLVMKKPFLLSKRLAGGRKFFSKSPPKTILSALPAPSIRAGFLFTRQIQDKSHDH
jgi:membrane protein DedA with SNARE-associated domain